MMRSRVVRVSLPRRAVASGVRGIRLISSSLPPLLFLTHSSILSFTLIMFVSAVSCLYSRYIVYLFVCLSHIYTLSRLSLHLCLYERRRVCFRIYMFVRVFVLYLVCLLDCLFALSVGLYSDISAYIYTEEDRQTHQLARRQAKQEHKKKTWNCGVLFSPVTENHSP